MGRADARSPRPPEAAPEAAPEVPEGFALEFWGPQPIEQRDLANLQELVEAMNRAEPVREGGVVKWYKFVNDRGQTHRYASVV